MSIKTRGNGGIPLRGGSGGSGQIQVGTTDGVDDIIVSPSVSKILWATTDLGFTASPDPDDETCIIIGPPANFLDPINWSTSQNTDVRVAVSDLAEADTYLTDGKEKTVMKGSLNDFRFTSSIGRGFGEESKLTVKTYHAGVLVDDVTFTGVAGTTTQGNVTAGVSSYAPDGDGSVNQGKWTVTVSGDGLIGSTNSGVVRVEISFLEQKWGERRNINQDIFRDKNPETPIITGIPSVQEDPVPANRITKFISGIQYYTLGSPFEIHVPDIDNHNDDSSKPSGSLGIDSSNFGIAPYVTSPWTDNVSWTNVGDLDTSQDFDYKEAKTIDVADFRHVGNALVGNVIRDSWNDAANKDSNTLKVCIDTHSNPSTDLVEYFDEENIRLDSDYTTSWDSTEYCVDGEAIVFGGRMYHGADLPRILESVQGDLGTGGSLSAFLPNETTVGASRQNPSYIGHTRPAVFFRRFISSGGTKSSFNMNIVSSGDIATQLQNGDVKIYIWKSGSTNPTSPNTVLPASYNPTNPSLSLDGSIWLHGTNDYNFGTFTDGAEQTNADATCRSKVTGTTVEGTFGGNDLEDGGDILVRLEVLKGHWLEEVSVTFK